LTAIIEEYQVTIEALGVHLRDSCERLQREANARSSDIIAPA
jgi:hypothetical protein